MADLKLKYASSASFTITLNSLASSATAGRESTAIDNTTNLYVDALVCVTVKLATGTPANDKCIYVYAYSSEDGTNFSDPATGSDAAITLRSPTNLALIGVISCPDSGALTYRSPALSLRGAFGQVPRKWGIVVRNYTGVALDSSGCSASYTGVQYSAV